MFEILTPRNTGAIAIISLHSRQENIAKFINNYWRVKKKNKLVKLTNSPISKSQAISTDNTVNSKIPEDETGLMKISYGFIVENDKIGAQDIILTSEKAYSENKTQTTQIIDEALLVFISENKIELHIHGGIGVTDRVVKLLKDQGFKHNPNQQNQLSKMFLKARTEKEAKIIANQPLQQKQILNEFIKLVNNSQEAEVLKALKKIKNNHKITTYLQNPPSVLLLGKPNVGKSTLFNYIAGFERVIVSDVSGTTRDVIENIVSINGWCIKLIDAAGVRTSVDFVEKASVIKTLKQAKQAELIVFMLDATRKMDAEENLIMKQLENRNHIISVNKSDVTKFDNPQEWLEISAKNGSGIKELLNKILEKFGFSDFADNSVLSINPFSIENIDYIENKINELLTNNMSDETKHHLISFIQRLIAEIPLLN